MPNACQSIFYVKDAIATTGSVVNDIMYLRINLKAFKDVDVAKYNNLAAYDNYKRL